MLLLKVVVFSDFLYITQCIQNVDSFVFLISFIFYTINIFNDYLHSYFTIIDF